MGTQSNNKEIIGQHQRHTMDTGSPEVQISLLSARISEISAHLTANPKDVHSKRGLQLLVSRRKRLMKYLNKKNHEAYKKLISTLGIRG